MKCCLQENSTNTDKHLQIFPANAIAPVVTIFTLLWGAFSSNTNPQFRFLKYIFHFHILMILWNKEKYSLFTIVHSIRTVNTYPGQVCCNTCRPLLSYLSMHVLKIPLIFHWFTKTTTTTQSHSVTACHIFMSSPFRVPVRPVQDPCSPRSGSPFSPVQDPRSIPYTFTLQIVYVIYFSPQSLSMSILM